MGLGAGDLRLLIWLKTGGHLPPGGSLVEIGAQQLSDSFLACRAELASAGRLFGVDRPCPLPPPLSLAWQDSVNRLDPAAPLARDFWTWLGFDYASIDIDGSPYSIPIDLNYDQVPEGCRGKYRLVTNYGTTEHVANQLNAFKIIHDLTAVGGLMVHSVPAQGMFCHGLVNYNPKFFWMLARSNGYKWLQMNYVHSSSLEPLPADVVDHVSMFDPDFSDRISRYRAADCALMVVLQKTFDVDYVAPLDVDTGQQTSNATLRKRYWTVFEPDAFERLLADREQAPNTGMATTKPAPD
jgi:hypothetical protein